MARPATGTSSFGSGRPRREPVPAAGTISRRSTILVTNLDRPAGPGHLRRWRASRVAHRLMLEGPNAAFEHRGHRAKAIAGVRAPDLVRGYAEKLHRHLEHFRLPAQQQRQQVLIRQLV